MTGIDSPEVTSILLNVALSVEGEELQQIAGAALWHHAADLRFKNPAVNQALKTLAEKGNLTGKENVRKALEDTKRYAKRDGEEGGSYNFWLFSCAPYERVIFERSPPCKRMGSVAIPAIETFAAHLDRL